MSNNATIYNDYKIAHTNYDMTQPIESYSNITCMAGESPYNEDNGPSGNPAGPACAPNDVGAWATISTYLRKNYEVTIRIA